MSQSLVERRSTALRLPDEMPGRTDAMPRPPTGIFRPILFLTLFMLLLWGGLGSWAAMSPIQSAVVASGSFKVEGELPVVQHLEGGLIREVRVREGAKVEKGEILAVLADTLSTAQDRILLNQLVSALALDERLAAEFRDQGALIPSAELGRLIGMDPSFADIFTAQQELFASNADMWAGQAAILQERLAEQKSQLSGIQSRHAAMVTRLGFVQEELADLEKLFDQRLIRKDRLTDRREAEILLLGDINYALSQMEGIRQRISETRERILQIRRDRARMLSEQRQQIKAQIFEIRQRMIANEDVKQRQFIRAPLAGKVIDLKVTTAGEVIKDGQDIMKIVPEGVSFVIEGQVKPEDVDQVHEGDAARVRLTAYNFRTTPTVEGKVTHVSADSFVDEQSGRSYFKVNVRLDEDALKALPDVEIQPGMPAQVMITTGEQTVADYIISPIWSSLETAMRESE